MSRPPLPPFTAASATQKVRLAEDGWNSRDPVRVALAYTPDCSWRNRAEFVTGRIGIEALLTRKWARELDYRLIKSIWRTTPTVSRCASPMNIMTTAASGSAPMATRIGNLTMMA